MSNAAPGSAVMSENSVFGSVRLTAFAHPGTGSDCADKEGGRGKCQGAPFASHAQSGFTLVELMVAVIVLAILASAALPSFRSFIVGQRVKNASFDAMSALTMARGEAIKRNTNVDIVPSGGNWLNGWTVAAGATVLKQQSALGNGLSVTCYSGAAAVPCQTITYAGSGRLLPGATAPSVLIAASDVSAATGMTARCVAVDLSGRTRSTRGSCA